MSQQWPDWQTVLQPLQAVPAMLLVFACKEAVDMQHAMRWQDLHAACCQLTLHTSSSKCVVLMRGTCACLCVLCPGGSLSKLLTTPSPLSLPQTTTTAIQRHRDREKEEGRVTIHGIA